MNYFEIIILILLMINFAGWILVFWWIRKIVKAVKDAHLDISVLSQNHDDNTKQIMTKVEQSVANVVTDLIERDREIEEETKEEVEDELFEMVKNVVSDMDKCSTSMLQRMFKIGYARAARMMDMLEEEGIIEQVEERSGIKEWKVVKDEDEDLFEEEDE